jgi:hypothetical protein
MDQPIRIGDSAAVCPTLGCEDVSLDSGKIDGVTCEQSTATFATASVL